jgi:ribosome modulation factor
MIDAYKQGYEDYYKGKEADECPYHYELEAESWEGWCDGHMNAYCEDEGK